MNKRVEIMRGTADHGKCAHSLIAGGTVAPVACWTYRDANPITRAPCRALILRILCDGRYNRPVNFSVDRTLCHATPASRRLRR
jgi:hypothetical protein